MATLTNGVFFFISHTATSKKSIQNREQVRRSNINLDWATHGLSLIKKIGKYKINMIDSDQCPDSNWHPPLKSIQ